MRTVIRWVEINLDAIAHNVKVVRREIGPAAWFTAVVKADGYGHGAVPVARVALSSGANELAVADIDEAMALRLSGVRAPILITGPVDPSQAKQVATHDLSVMVDTSRLLHAFSSVAGRRPVGVQIEVDLGLGRWGIKLKDLSDFFCMVKKARGVRLEGMYAHPGYVAGKNELLVRKRLAEFRALTDPLLVESPFVRRHVADSTILVDMPEYRLEAVRVGNLLYGIFPTQSVLPLKNPWRPLSKIIRISRVRAGARLGYGSDYVSPRSATVGTVPVGYGHGLTMEPASILKRRNRSFLYWGTVRGVRCDFLGKPGMNHVLVDLTGVTNPREGEEIQLPLRRTVTSGWPKVYTKH
jgi:alanine racemase